MPLFFQVHMNNVQTQMSTKGGYEHITPVQVQLNVIDVQKPES